MQKNTRPTEASGYVHNVSEIQTARNARKTRFFDFDLQIGSVEPESLIEDDVATSNSPEPSTTFRRTVCFEEKMRTELKEVEMQRSPVKLRNVTTSPNVKTKDLDFVFGRRSIIENVNNADVNFEYGSPRKKLKWGEEASETKESAVVELENVSAFIDLEASTKVQLTGKFIVLKDIIKKVFKNGKLLKLMENCAIVDHTGYVQFSVWGDCFDKMEHGNWYTFNVLVIKHFQRKYISTTWKTEVEKISPTDVNEELVEENERKARLELFPVACIKQFHFADEFSVKLICNSCTAPLTDITTLDALKCSECGGIQMVNFCKRLAKVRLWANVGREEMKLKFKDQVFEKLIELLNEKSSKKLKVKIGYSTEIEICSLILGEAKDLKIEYDKVGHEVVDIKMV